ncbi:MAG: hypothetical protein QOE70_2286 [Chthoniobacter sp.]|jgi:glycine/D-amino acid oxidase-like deaminating enzyme|nr:hypothetical protein [Chthoniobacter sp.]
MDLKSSHPFWPLQDGLLGIYPSLKQDLHCEVAIVGGGISGALVADALIREGVDVVLVDRRDIAGGSTSASTALLQYEIDVHLTDLARRYGRADAERVYRLCLESIGKTGRLLASDDCGFEPRSSVYLASQPSDVPGLRAEWRARRRAGIDVRFLSARELGRRFSFEGAGAILSSDAAVLNPYRATHALVARATRGGLRVFDRTAVTVHQVGKRHVVLKSDRGCKIIARKVVFAAGYEAGAFLKRRIARLHSTFAFVSEPLAAFPGWDEKCTLWETARPYFYLRTTTDGRVLVGGEDVPFRDPEKRDRLIPRQTARLLWRFRKMFPEVDLEVAFAWAGTFGETDDGLAYIGTVPEMPHCYFALGFGGNGVTFSVIASELLRDAILGRLNPDARLFRFDR